MVNAQLSDELYDDVSISSMRSYEMTEITKVRRLWSGGKHDTAGCAVDGLVSGGSSKKIIGTPIARVLINDSRPTAYSTVGRR